MQIHYWINFLPWMKSLLMDSFVHILLNVIHPWKNMASMFINVMMLAYAKYHECYYCQILEHHRHGIFLNSDRSCNLDLC
jgi:hypothetical protein